MRYVTVVLFVLVLIAVCAPIPTAHQYGTYNTVSHLAWCKTYDYCLHEIGHALDQQAGWISQSAEFYRALQMYLYIELRQPQLDALPANILELTYRGGDGTYSIKLEIYAYLFQWAQGKPEYIPEALRGFYDWDDARRMISNINDTQHIYWMQ